MEQHKIGYIFPDEIRNNSNERQDQNSDQSTESSSKPKIAEQDWQFVIPVSDNNKSTEESDTDESEISRDEFIQVTSYQDDPNEAQSSAGGIFPAARARLASLRDLGARKIGALKLKLIENKIKSSERGMMHH